MIYILARRSRDKIPMAKPNEPDMLPELTKKRYDYKTCIFKRDEMLIVRFVFIKQIVKMVLTFIMFYTYGECYPLSFA